jgi:hypothetical protein
VVWQPGPAETEGVDPAADRISGAGPRPGSKSRRRAVALILLAAGLCGLAVSAAGVVSQLVPRRFSSVQERQIMTWEIARRWRTYPAGRIFPAAVSYQIPAAVLDSGKGLTLQAPRLGIARQASCARVAGPAAGRILVHYRCSAVLRATYVDASGSMVATVGVAVLPNVNAAFKVVSALTKASGLADRSVRPFAVHGTAAAGFTEPKVQLIGATDQGTYVIMSVVGFTDGRPRLADAADSFVDAQLKGLARGIAGTVAGIVGASPAVPRCPGAPGC